MISPFSVRNEGKNRLALKLAEGGNAMIRRMSLWTFLLLAWILELITVLVGVLFQGKSWEEASREALPIPGERWNGGWE